MNPKNIVLTDEEQKIENNFYNAYTAGKIEPIFVNLKEEKNREKRFISTENFSLPREYKITFFSLAKKEKISPQKLFSKMLEKYQLA